MLETFELTGPIDTEETPLLNNDKKNSKPLEPDVEPAVSTTRRHQLLRASVLFMLACFVFLGVKWSRRMKQSAPSGWAESSTPVHVVVFVADDQGGNDVGYQSTDLYDLTPTIDALAADGIKLTNYYSHLSCTPARASLLTGLYTINMGMQHNVVTSNYPYGLPLDLAIMPQYFKAAGYSTAMFGKWHLGHFRHAHLPRARGFDDFMGFYSGFQKYFTHESEPTYCADECLLDLRNGTTDVDAIVRSSDYAPELWRNAFESLVSSHDTSKPLFVYYAESLVHEPLEAPSYIYDEYASQLDQISNANRTKFAAMTVYLDSAVSSIISSLRGVGMWNNTVFVYVSDNGGDSPYLGFGNNWPKRGAKGSLFDGGIKVPAFVHSPLLPTLCRGITYNNLVHVTDWLPTLVEGVLGRGDLLGSRDISGSTRQRKGLDGVNQWSHMLSGGGSYSSESPRREIMVNLDYLDGDHLWQGYDTAAIIVGPWKLILNERNETSWLVPGSQPIAWDPTNSTRYNYLFNLEDDPNECVNLIDDLPDMVTIFVTKIAAYRANMVDSLFCGSTLQASYEYQELSGEGFVGPWDTAASGELDYLCPWRILSDDTLDTDYDPSFLGGETGAAFFGDDATF